jgi:hypothetical protein
MSDDVENDVELFKAGLGEELEFLAEGLAPAVTSLARDVAAAAVGEAVAPLLAQHQVYTDRESEKETAAVMASFTQSHPDWPTHEPAMLALARQIQPNGMTELEFLEHLYAAVGSAAQEEAEVAAATAAAEADARRAARPEVPTLREAYEAAKRGEMWDAPAPPPEVRAVARPAVPTLRDAYAAAKRGERWE